ncbi:P-loop containing nucleoside triphosphate hydrolase protein [Morchella snyderi]|nr:P-loop containing nucleoside triphosphate hydrolase protein [Morchella snyderi]
MTSRLLSRAARTGALRLASAPPLLKPYRPLSLALVPDTDRHHRSRGYATATLQAVEAEDGAVELLSEYPTTSPAARKILHDAWGYTSFRAEQEAVIARLLHGGSAVAVFPTGSGKSLLYQVAALGFGDGVTVVVSPLIALIKDQVQDLKRRGIAAAAVDSTVGRKEVQAVFERVRNNEVRLLYVAPERLNNAAFVELLRTVTVRLIAVDEAHCVYEWGHSFRPEYLRVPIFVKKIKAERVLCVTATVPMHHSPPPPPGRYSTDQGCSNRCTNSDGGNGKATPEITESITTAFGIPSDGVFRTSTYRPNLQLLSQSFTNSPDKFDYLAGFLDANPGPTIVYTLKRSTAELVAKLLERAGIKALPYHAGMDKVTRSTTQDRFMKNGNITIVATIAFGLGINKSNIRNIIHYGPPLSVENYAQEIGRAGRDGLPSKCLILTAPADFHTHRSLTASTYLTPNKHAMRRLLWHISLSHSSAPAGTPLTLPLHALAYAFAMSPARRKKQKLEEAKWGKPPLMEAIRAKEDATVSATALLMKIEIECGLLKALPMDYGEVSYHGLARLQGLVKDDAVAEAVVEESVACGGGEQGEQWEEWKQEEQGGNGGKGGKGGKRGKRGESKVLWSFEVRRVCERAGVGREALLRRLHKWEYNDVVNIVNLGAAARYEVMRALPRTEEAIEEVVERVHGVVKMHARRRAERQKRVLELVAGNECFVEVLARHFGDVELVGRGACGHCQWCLDRRGRGGGRGR